MVMNVNKLKLYKYMNKEIQNKTPPIYSEGENDSNMNMNQIIDDDHIKEDELKNDYL